MSDRVYPESDRYASLWAVLAGMALLLGLALLAGCSPVDSAYLEADRATLETVGAEWSTYFHGDTSLSRDDVMRRERKLESWRARIEQAENE